MFSDKMEDDSTSVGHCVFRGVEYVVTMQVQNGNSLMIEVEDRVTADQWRATLDSTCGYIISHLMFPNRLVIILGYNFFLYL